MRSQRMARKEARLTRQCKKQRNMKVKMVSSSEVPNSLVQDYSREMVVVGTDVVSLYPNLTWEAAGEEVFRAIFESEMEWEGVNWKSGVLYLALCRGYAWCKASQLRRILPSR